MKKTIPLILLSLILVACKKNNNSTPQIQKTTNQDSIKILGSWYNLNIADSSFNLDGSFNKYSYTLGDTSPLGKQVYNYMIFKPDGTFLTPITVAPSPTTINTTYYDFISANSYSETPANLFTGARDGLPVDTVTIKNLSDSNLTLLYVGNGYYFDQGFHQVFIRYHKTENWIK